MAATTADIFAATSRWRFTTSATDCGTGTRLVHLSVVNCSRAIWEETGEWELCRKLLPPFRTQLRQLLHDRLDKPRNFLGGRGLVAPVRIPCRSQRVSAQAPGEFALDGRC